MKFTDRISKAKIKTKLAFYFIGFTAIMLSILWICQTVMLEEVYRLYKTASIKKQAEEITELFESDDLQSDIEQYSKKYGLCIIVADSEGNIRASVEAIQECTIHKMNSTAIKEQYNQVLENDGTYVEAVSDGHIYKPDDTDKGKLKPFARDCKSMIYSIVTTKGTKQYLAMLETELAPIAATVEALRIELIVMTIIVMLLAVLIVGIMSAKLSKPIINTNEAAKKLALGEFSTEFKNTGYKEIAELNETLEYASKELAQVDKLTHEIIANVSHDLRTPLTMISGYAEAMRDIPGESSPENLQIIIDEAERLKNLVNQLLYLSKLESGSNKLEKSRFSITDTTKEIIARLNKMIEQDGYKVTFAYIENAKVYADQARIEQVIYNLISNAIAYTGEDGKVLVRQTVLNNSVKIEVIDSGRGIEPDMIPYVWKRYYKNPYAKTQYKGVGVGLSIVKGILDAHKAEYGITSEVGNGSDFWFAVQK